MPRTEGSYTRRQEGEESVFSVTPGVWAASARPGIDYGLIFATALTVICFPVGLALLIPRLLVSVGGGAMVLGKRKPLLRPVTIRVRPGQLTLPPELSAQNGRDAIARNDLHQLVVRNYILVDEGYVTTQLVGQGTAVAANQMGRVLRMDMARHLGWAVDAEAGGRAYTLAFGLSEVTANGLMEDVYRALNG